MKKENSIFSITGDNTNAIRVDEASFTELKIWERRDIQEWIRKNPTMLGEELLIISIEFDRFKVSNDRLDILALDRKGNLVVVELKRDLIAGHADLQAIRYAAMISSMTIDHTISYFKEYKSNYDNEQLSDEEARDRILDFIDDEDFAELSNSPRIILGSQGFSQEITTTVLWLLHEAEIDIKCVELCPYLIEKKLVIVPKVIIPLPEAKEYQDQIKEKEEKKRNNKKKQHLPRIGELFEWNILKAGDELKIKNKENSTATVLSPKHVNYNGQKMTYNQWGLTVTGWSSICIYDQAIHTSSGHTLDKLRKDKMEEDPDKSEAA